jgi:hypothetical protein
MSDTNETSASSDDTSAGNENSASINAPTANVSGTVQPAAVAAEPQAASASATPVEIGGSGAVNPSTADGGPAAGSTATVRNKVGRPIKVTIVAAPAGKKSKVSWVWQLMRQFTPPVNSKNVFCAVEVLRRGVRTQCRHLLTWIAKNGTTGMLKHVQKEHKAEYARLKLQYGSMEEAKEEVINAIGECVLHDLPVLSV